MTTDSAISINPSTVQSLKACPKDSGNTWADIPMGCVLNSYNLAGGASLITWVAQWYSVHYVQGYNTTSAVVTVPKGTSIWICYRRMYA